MASPEIVGAIIVCSLVLALRLCASSVWSIAALAIPGTIAHEATHFLVGLVLMAKPVNVSLFPKKVGDRWVLGSVGFRSINLLNAAPVAMAPLLLLPVAIWIGQDCLAPALERGNVADVALWSAAAASCVDASLPSGQDLRLGGLSLLIYGAMALVLFGP